MIGGGAAKSRGRRVVLGWSPMGLMFDLAGGLRVGARWCLLPALLLWPLMPFLFGSAVGQFAIFGIAFFLGLIAVLLAGIGLLTQWICARFVDRHVAWREIRRDGLCFLLAPILWGAVMRSRVDAHLWLWWHEADLREIAARALATDERHIRGHVVQVHGDVVLFVQDGIMQRYGVAWDPLHALERGSATGMRIVDVCDLRGPWRLWGEDD